VIKNENTGYNWSVAASIERPLLQGIYGKLGYNYAVAKNTVDPGSIAFGSWSANQVPGNANQLFRSDTARRRPAAGSSARCRTHRTEEPRSRSSGTCTHSATAATRSPAT